MFLFTELRPEFLADLKGLLFLGVLFIFVYVLNRFHRIPYSLTPPELVVPPSKPTKKK